MKTLFSTLMAISLAAPLPAQETLAASNDTADAEVVQAEAEDIAPSLRIADAQDVELADFLWVNRPVVVFANTDADPRFNEQLELLLERPEELLERDVVIITDTDPNAKSPVRIKLRPRGFQLALIGKDGGVKLRKPFPWDVRELTRVIDKMPLRQQEIRESAGE